MLASPSTPSKKGILKSKATGAAKKEAEKTRCLAAVRSEIWFKVLILGADHAGKSSIARCMGGEKPSSIYEHTDGVHTTTCLVASFQSRPVFVQLWEVPYSAALADPAKDKSLQHSVIFNGVHAAIICFDTTDSGASGVAPLEAVDHCRDAMHLRVIQRLVGSAADAEETFPLYLAAHKADILAPMFASSSTSTAASSTVHPAEYLTANQAQSKFGFDNLRLQKFFGFDLPSSVPKATAAKKRPSTTATSSSSSLDGSSSREKKMPFAFGLDTSDLDAYCAAAGYRAWYWTSTQSTSTTSTSLQTLLTDMVDDMLEYWGYLVPDGTGDGRRKRVLPVCPALESETTRAMVTGSNTDGPWI